MNSRPFVETHTAGDTLEMSIANGNAITVADYPASDDWTLKYRLTPQFSTPTQAPIDITATTDTDGASYKIEVSPAATATWKAGSYWWARWVEKVGARVMLERDQQLDILPDPAQSAQGEDRRTYARKMLEQIEAALLSRSLTAQREVLSYTIGTRSQTFDAAETKIELERLREQYKLEVMAEEGEQKLDAGGQGGRRMLARL
jgi:hypothetical protein